jgi:hypothetical protein
MMYRNLRKEAKRRENDKYAFNAKAGTKAVWQVINTRDAQI